MTRKYDASEWRARCAARLTLRQRAAVLALHGNAFADYPCDACTDRRQLAGLERSGELSARVVHNFSTNAPRRVYRLTPYGVGLAVALQALDARQTDERQAAAQ